MPALLKPLMVETAKQKFKMPQGTASGGVTQQTCQNYITTMCDAIVSAVEQWRQTAMLSGVTINGPIAKGGKVTGPALQPVILTLAPKSNPWEKNLSDAISGGVSDCWKDWQGSLQVPGLPWYPQFAAWPDLVAPPMPNVPSPLSALGQRSDTLKASGLRMAMTAKLKAGTPCGTEVIAALAEGVAAAVQTWLTTQFVTQVMGTGRTTCAPPVVPFGQVTGGTGNGLAFKG